MAVKKKVHKVYKVTVSSEVIRPIQQHKCSNIYFVLIYATCFGRQFRPPSDDITKNIRNKIYKTILSVV